MTFSAQSPRVWQNQLAAVAARQMAGTPQAHLEIQVRKQIKTILLGLSKFSVCY